MPQLIPPTPDFASTAEEAAWTALAAALPEEATLLVGQRITQGGREIEIDLLVLWPGIGTAVIEVKGGLVEVRDGRWTQTSHGETRALRRSPVDQAQIAKHELLRFMTPRSSRPVGRAAHLVAVPYTQLPADWDAPDAPRCAVLDATDLADGASERLLGRLTEALGTLADQRFDPLDDLQRDVMVKALRRTHLAIRNHRLEAQRIEDEGNQLTREQEKAISLLRHQRRAQIVGGAGSGKTHLALMKARALAAAGERTALLCYSRGLAHHFEIVTAAWPEHERPAYVGLFHDLPTRLGAPDEEAWVNEQLSAIEQAEGGDAAQDEERRRAIVAAYYEQHLPSLLPGLATALPQEDLFDAIVVDEGQDFADLWWDALLPCLRDAEDGLLWVFSDEHQGVFDRTGRAPITLSPFPLDDNLRNTRTIARAFAPLTATAQTPRMEDGPAVVFVPAWTENAVEEADDQVDKLLGEGWEPGDIALLTTGRRHPVQIERVDYDGYEGYWDEFFAGTDVFYGHVLGAKGLERRVVVLALNGFYNRERAARQLYVGLSRARTLLVVVGDPAVLREVGGEEVAALVTGR